MLRYLLILLLINTYGRSSGSPVYNSGSNGKISIANLLSDLMKECNNKFATAQIANSLMERSLKECNLTAPPFYEIEMQCLVLLDASSLLCNISTASFPNLAADFKSNTSGKLTADEFCAEAAHFSPVPTTFQSLIASVFQKDAACKKVCMDKDVLSDDTHFVCKYYKWSMGIFQTSVNNKLKNSTLKNGLPISGPETVEVKASETVTTNANNASRVPIRDPEMIVNETSSINVQNDQLQSHLGSSSNGLTTSVLNQITTNNSKPVKPSDPEENHEKPPLQITTGHDEDNLDGEGNADTVLNQENPVGANGQGGPVIGDNGQGGPVISTNGQGGPVIGTNGQGSPVIGTNGQGGAVIGTNGQGDPVIGTNGQGGPVIGTNGRGPDIDHHDAGAGDIGDIGDSEREEGNVDDDGGDDMGPDMDIRDSQPAPNTKPQHSQGDFLPSMSESFTEDDDHFFPFFLTAVIIVIILYVLYHNKNKVGKMFFGLIVEGRQPGRRRNSRGHSYRRLDTLEQAMSASAPAPPSKIIY